MAGQQFAGLVLAAGQGSRFPGEADQPYPKVLRSLLGRPVVSYVLDTLAAAGVRDITVVVGFGADRVTNVVGDSVSYVMQEERLGSGHAVKCAKDRFEAFDGHLVVMCGDSPLFAPETVRSMMREHVETGAAATLVSAMLEDPSGYGRIVRDAAGLIGRVAEEKCASESELAIREVNGGAYVFQAGWLFANIDGMALNEAGEYNLTDMVRVAAEQGKAVESVECYPRELLGVNTPEELASVESILRGRR